MAGKRIERLNEQFKREISGILRTEVRDPRVGAPTVTDVRVTPDLWVARVYVRAEPGSSGEGLLEGLRAAAPFVRRELGRILSLRRIPELRFDIDRAQEQASRIDEILREVLPEDEEEER